MARINRTPRFRLIRGWGRGRGSQRVSARNSDRVGAIINKVVEVARGRRGSLIKSFMASASG